MDNTYRASIWLFFATALYFVMNGAQLWETALMVPAWTAAPPESLFFFKGPHGLDFKYFWMIVHSVHDLVLILAIAFNWRLRKRRNIMLMLFAVHIAMRVWTLTYFAPTLMSFMALDVQPGTDVALLEKATTWKLLNYLRVAIYVMVNFGYTVLLIRAVKPREE
ncbi:transposase [Chitinophaga sp. OAE865]|uniref:transposase n=1 Tax=Chitinophaga sp. OAE865 TaxID=2817898 RepID=UPI001AEA91C1